MKYFILNLSFLLVLDLCLSAQEPVTIPDKEGTWTYGYLDDENTKLYCRQFGMTPQEIIAFRKKLDQIVELLHQNPVLANPKGVDPTVESRPLYPHGYEKHAENFGYIGEINFRLVTWFSSKGRIYKQNIEPPRVSLYVNNIIPLRYSAFRVGGMEDAEIKKVAERVLDICKPMRIKSLSTGVTLYDAAIVICKPDKPLYLPLTVAEAYNRLIAYYETISKKEPVFGVMLDGIRKEFSTLTQAQLSAPAYFGGMFSGITPEKNNDPLFVFNREFFDRTSPRTAVQLIVFPISADYFRKESDFGPNSGGFFRIWQFLHSLDYEALAGLID